MKYINEFRDASLAKKLTTSIIAEVDTTRRYAFMEFCGGHTHAISRYGITDLIPTNIRLIHGPGCPVCVLPIGRIDHAISLAMQEKVILCTYGDAFRIPASHGLSLQKARANGADIRMLHSCSDALRLAMENQDRQVVFLAIGFETTTPPTAALILQAKKQQIKNLSVLCNHVLTPAAMHAILGQPEENASEVKLDGIIGPAHVSAIIGYQPYEAIAQTYKIPIVIAGFEPLDVMQAIRMMVHQVNHGQHQVENEFSRVVSREGNQKAQAMMQQIFSLRKNFEWRGLGQLDSSALAIRPEYGEFDAEKRFELKYHPVADHPACACDAILRGQKEPEQCKLFAKLCIPENPIGACMVSSEGACAAHYVYGRGKARSEPIN